MNWPRKTDEARQLNSDKTRCKRAQASLELLVLLAAMLAALVFFLPYAEKSMAAVRELALVEKQKAALQQMAFLAREAHALGKGTELQQTIEFKAETRLAAKNRQLVMKFASEKPHELTEELGFVLELENGEGKWANEGEEIAGMHGTWSVKMKNEGVVQARFVSVRG